MASTPWVVDAGEGGVLAGWEAPIYQATDGPPMMAMVPQRFAIYLMLPTMIIAMLWWKILLVSGALYIVAFFGTRWEPYWYTMLLEYFDYAGYYEG
jgi:uncharacterized membrane protein